jgi:peptidoglycan hydrolase-like protein with peptidoglycan-binding domain
MTYKFLPVLLLICGLLVGLGGASALAAVPNDYLFAWSLGVGDRGEGVLQLQERLKALGVYTGPLTGYYGPLTQAAVELYQSRNQVATTGFVGPLTRSALNETAAVSYANIGLPSAGGALTRTDQLADLQRALLELELAARQLQLIRALD